MDILVHHSAAAALDILVWRGTGVVHIVGCDIEARAVIDQLIGARCILDISLTVRLGQRIPMFRTVLERRLTIIFLVDARLLHEVELELTARNRTHARRRTAVLEVRAVQGIVSQQMLIARIRRRHDIVCNARSVGNICGFRYPI